MRVFQVSPNSSLLVKSILKASGRPVVRAECLVELLALIDDRNIEVGECYRHFRVQSLEELSRVNRHLLWLAKHGFIRIEPALVK